MKRPPPITVATFVTGLVLLMMPVRIDFWGTPIIYAQSEPAKTAPPPVAQPLIREGEFAVKLVSVFELGAAADEVEAETLLAQAGIAPGNGWIADYPVTPDIAGELQKAVSNAADSRKFTISKGEAVKRFQDALAALKVSFRPFAGSQPEPQPSVPESYSNPAVINNYYATEGPPVVTYYAPPPDYLYLYAWVPCPFWWDTFWFPGYYILNDFHRVVVAHGSVLFVTNHFNDIRVHRVFRIDPVKRFRGTTFAGIGAPHGRGFISTGVPGSPERIFNRRGVQKHR